MTNTLNTSFDGLDDQRKDKKTISGIEIKTITNGNIKSINLDTNLLSDNSLTASDTEVNSEQPKINPDTILESTDKYCHGVNTDYPDMVLKSMSVYRTDTTQIPPPVNVIKIFGESVGTYGNVITISGAPKAAKSATASVIVAGSFAEGEYDGLDGLEVLHCKGKAVLHFDTEQSRHQHQSNLRTILKRVQLTKCPPNLKSYNIRGEDIQTYKTITEEVFDATFKKFGKSILRL